MDMFKIGLIIGIVVIVIMLTLVFRIFIYKEVNGEKYYVIYIGENKAVLQQEDSGKLITVGSHEPIYKKLFKSDYIYIYYNKDTSE